MEKIPIIRINTNKNEYLNMHNKNHLLINTISPTINAKKIPEIMNYYMEMDMNSG